MHHTASIVDAYTTFWATIGSGGEVCPDSAQNAAALIVTRMRAKAAGPSPEFFATEAKRKRRMLGQTFFYRVRNGGIAASRRLPTHSGGSAILPTQSEAGQVPR